MNENKCPELENRFSYHAPKEGQPEKYEEVRDSIKAVAYTLSRVVPKSRELSTALTHLDAAMMFACAGIARNENTGE